MNCLEDVPFQTPLGSLHDPLRDLALVTAPDMTMPNYHQILQDTEYKFTLENWALTRLQPACQACRCGSRPSCPPYWLMFSSPQESRCASRKRSDLWAPAPRPRSHSLSSADHHRLPHRAVRFLISAAEEEAGYSEDDEGSSTDDASNRFKGDKRPRSTPPKDPLSRVKDLHCGNSPQHFSPRRNVAGYRTPPTSQELPKHASPPCQGTRQCRKRDRSFGSANRKHSPNAQPASPTQFRPRPSSAGPAIRNRRQNMLRSSGSHEVFFDSSAEILSVCTDEERELLEAITEKGYPLRTAILALQKTGYRSPDKILKYLVASSRLCGLGYDEAQVEEALEMFQNCESKAAEFLRLLTQFNEMGFQQNVIKEVLLVHENHHERALEELMTRLS